MRAVTGADQIICSMYLCRSVPLQRSRCGGDERDTKEGSCALAHPGIFRPVMAAMLRAPAVLRQVRFHSRRFTYACLRILR